MKKNERVVPIKNYIYLLIMIIVVVALTFLIFNINKNYQTEKLETSYLANYLTVVKTEELSNILSEPSSELFIFVTKTNDENVFNLEKDLKKIIKKHDLRDQHTKLQQNTTPPTFNLRDNFILLDYTDESNVEELNKILKSDIETLPAIIYIKNGEFIKSIDSKESLLKSSDFEKMLDEYEVN